MSSAVEAQSLMQEAWPITKTGSVQQSIDAAYRFMRSRVTDRLFTYRRVETIWQGKIPYALSQEMDALRAAQIKEARNDQKILRSRLASLDEYLAIIDEDFHRETLAGPRP